jgi:hypothetical protein
MSDSEKQAEEARRCLTELRTISTETLREWAQENESYVVFNNAIMGQLHHTVKGLLHHNFMLYFEHSIKSLEPYLPRCGFFLLGGAYDEKN